MRLITLLIALLLFNGCASKEPKVIKEYETICIKQEIYSYGSSIKVRVHPQDLEIHKARAEYLKKGFDFYEAQINRNNECLKIKDKETK